MVKILQARLQQFVNQELLYIQSGFRKGRGTRDQSANICWIMKRARELQKNICFIDYTKAFDCVDHNKLWKIFKEMGVPDHLTCLPRNQHVDQEATIKTRHETTAWIKTGKGVQQGCLLSPCSLNIYRMHVCMLSCFNKVQLFATIWAVACQASLSMGFSRQEYWSGLPCPPPRDIPDPGIEPAFPMSPALAGGFFTTSATWEAL